MTKNLTADSLNLLLAELSPNERQAADDYIRLRDSLIRFFDLRGDSDPEAAADQTLDRTALKIAAKTPIGNITKYSFGIARLISLERLRFARKEKTAAQEFYAENLCSINDAETDDLIFLRECFAGLPPAERTFLQSYFADAPHRALADLRRRLNAEMGFSAGQAQVKVFRLRKRLAECVRAKNKNK